MFILLDYVGLYVASEFWGVVAPVFTLLGGRERVQPGSFCVPCISLPLGVIPTWESMWLAKSRLQQETVPRPCVVLDIPFK